MRNIISVHSEYIVSDQSIVALCKLIDSYNNRQFLFDLLYGSKSCNIVSSLPHRKELMLAAVDKDIIRIYFGDNMYNIVFKVYVKDYS